MPPRAPQPFETITTEGGLLPPDLLVRVAALDKGLDGLTAGDYHLADGERVHDAVARAWSVTSAAWSRFQEALVGLPAAEAKTGVTRDRWLLPLFRELGFGQLATQRAVEVEGKNYAVSHAWNHSPIHLVGCGLDLDKKAPGERGAARMSPHGLVQEFLNRSEDHMWGFVSNGYSLRILRDNVTLTRQSYVEFELQAIWEGERYGDFALLWLLCHQSRVESPQPQDCWLERWSRTAHVEGTRALDAMRDGVQSAIEELGSGFLAHRSNAELHERLHSGALSTEDYYRQLLRLVYRLIFLLVAEARELLLSPDAPRAAKDLYQRFYSTERLRRLAEKRRGTQHADLWRGLRLVMRALGSDKGCPPLALPPLGSFLWSDTAMPDLDACELSNRNLLEASRKLLFRAGDRVLRPVDWRHLGAEELGGIYESLLELHPELNREAGTFALMVAAGNERKTTGSYYTPTSLVECLLEAALDPVLDEAAMATEPVKAILALKVCDPACGSGHFLIAAANRIARRLAAARTPGEEPAPPDVRTALRDVIGHCVYGVDVNPMAVELCKVNLWLEAIDPGRPLSFLDHRIVCGNALLGTTPRLIAEGIPDEAFEPIQGDDRKTAQAFKKQNKREHTGRTTTFFADMARETPPEYRAVEAGFAGIEAMDDSSIEGIHGKEDAFLRVTQSAGYRRARSVADAWCAAFVWPRKAGAPEPITEGFFIRMRDDGRDPGVASSTEIERLRSQYSFLHWHLAFPEVFHLPSPGSTAQNPRCGWDGGFDVVLGNPPWERVKLQEKEWFAAQRPDIATASNAAERKRRIEALRVEDPKLFQAFLDDLRKADGESHLVRAGGRYPLCGRGDINTYAIFAETMRALLSPRGRVGTVLPSGIATDDTTKLFFQDLIATGTLVSLFDFENRAGLFPAVDSRMRFALVSMVGAAQGGVALAEFAFFLNDVGDLMDSERRFALSAEEIALLNPNTRTCPIFRTRRDAELTKGIYRRVPVLVKEGPPEENAWGVRFARLYDMTNDSALFRTRDVLETEGASLEGNVFYRGRDRYLPLYEGRFGHQFNHRFASQPRGDLQESALRHLADARHVVEPQYWVAESEALSRLARRAASCETGLLGHRRVARNTDERTAIAAILPWGAASYGWILSLGPSAHDLLLLLAAYNSFCFDYLVRSFLSQPSIPQSTIEQIACPPPTAFTEPLRGLVAACALELTFTAYDLQPFARDVGYDGPPFQWDSARRVLLRCELDAAFFHLYGVGRGDADFIMDSFPIVRATDERLFGEYRTKRVVLERYDAVLEAVQRGIPYESPLRPPPGVRSAAGSGVPDESLDRVAERAPRYREVDNGVE